MAQWNCTTCGDAKECRCKPQKCPSCEIKGQFVKVEEVKEEQ